DSDEPGGPVFDWVELSGVGTPVGFPSNADDRNVGPVPIGFDFPFYANTFNELHVCSNGWVSFTNSTRTTFSNQPLPNSGSSVPENLLAVWWDDMVHTASLGHEVLYYNDGSRFILQYFVRRFGSSTPPFYRFQVILYPNGNIVYQYHTLGTTISSSTIGIQNATKDDGLTVVHNDSSYPHEGLAILFSAGPDWLNVSPTSGVVPPGECVDLQVVMDASELEAGDYTGTITVTSNDPANPAVASEVVFHVGTIDAAETAIDPESLNLMSNGNWITGHIELPTEYDPANVVIETVRFMDVLPANTNLWAWDDDFNENSVADLMFKFDRMAAEELLPTGDSVMVWVSGEIRDTTWFVARDYVRVFRPGLVLPNGGEMVLAGSSTDIVWENPQNRAVDYANLYYSPDDGATWTEIATNVTGLRYTWTVPTAVTETGRIRVAVYDARGMLGFDSSNDPFTVTDDVTDAGLGLPKVYALRQNVPNPFNPSTRIHFDLPKDSDVLLRIYDVRGRGVQVLVNKRMPAGRHSVVWDGNADGRRVASGIYFYEIKAGSFRDTRRMTVLK
ncbi:MAG: T9SS type A sorting domain-containing protein, partial [Acidimicrobiia bacterium]|nr:T9SS type A sorting domain-containing protein [Acidimicrobiia bacterium]